MREKSINIISNSIISYSENIENVDFDLFIKNMSNILIDILNL